MDEIPTLRAFCMVKIRWFLPSRPIKFKNDDRDLFWAHLLEKKLNNKEKIDIFLDAGYKEIALKIAIKDGPDPDEFAAITNNLGLLQNILKIKPSYEHLIKLLLLSLQYGYYDTPKFLFEFSGPHENMEYLRRDIFEYLLKGKNIEAIKYFVPIIFKGEEFIVLSDIIAMGNLDLVKHFFPPKFAKNPVFYLEYCLLANQMDIYEYLKSISPKCLDKYLEIIMAVNVRNIPVAKEFIREFGNLNKKKLLTMATTILDSSEFLKFLLEEFNWDDIHVWDQYFKNIARLGTPEMFSLLVQKCGGLKNWFKYYKYAYSTLNNDIIDYLLLLEEADLEKALMHSIQNCDNADLIKHIIFLGDFDIYKILFTLSFKKFPHSRAKINSIRKYLAKVSLIFPQ